MGDTTTLYRYPECPHVDGPLEHWCVRMKPDPVEFRKVSWCKTHDAEWCTFTGQGFENSDGCWRAAFDGGMARNGSSWVDDDCVQAVRAFDKEPDHE